MADIILKVGDSETYKDGDVLCAFTDRHISCVHAQNICNPRNFGFKSDGYRSVSDLPFKMFQEFYQYMFERISNTEVRRTLLSDSTFEVFSDKTKEQIYAAEYIKRRLKNSNHLIFGEAGKEIWFGGRSDFSQTKVDNVWAQITANTGLLKTDHALWPIGTAEPYDFLPLGLDADIADDDAAILISQKTEEQDGETVILEKRTRFIPWQDMDTISPVTIAKINNINTPVDKREQYPITLSENLQVKS